MIRLDHLLERWGTPRPGDSSGKELSEGKALSLWSEVGEVFFFPDGEPRRKILPRDLARVFRIFLSRNRFRFPVEREDLRGFNLTLWEEPFVGTVRFNPVVSEFMVETPNEGHGSDGHIWRFDPKAKAWMLVRWMDTLMHLAY